MVSSLSVLFLQLGCAFTSRARSHDQFLLGAHQASIRLFLTWSLFLGCGEHLSSWRQWRSDVLLGSLVGTRLNGLARRAHFCLVSATSTAYLLRASYGRGHLIGCLGVLHVKSNDVREWVWEGRHLVPLLGSERRIAPELHFLELEHLWMSGVAFELLESTGSLLQQRFRQGIESDRSTHWLEAEQHIAHLVKSVIVRLRNCQQTQSRELADIWLDFFFREALVQILQAHLANHNNGVKGVESTA